MNDFGERRKTARRELLEEARQKRAAQVRRYYILIFLAAFLLVVIGGLGFMYYRYPDQVKEKIMSVFRKEEIPISEGQSEIPVSQEQSEIPNPSSESSAAENSQPEDDSPEKTVSAAESGLSEAGSLEEVINDPENMVSENLENAISEDPVESVETRTDGKIMDYADPESWFDGDYELPLNGAAGYASVGMDVTDQRGTVISSLVPGSAFRILEDEGRTLYIALPDGRTGYVPENLCMVNLPDVLPSVIYTDTNSDSSLFRSSGCPLPGITGQQLYDARCYNDRYQQTQYVMPVLYHMAEKVAKAQKKALSMGLVLNIYETYRPHDVQMQISSSLTRLMNENETVALNINKAPWNKNWFIAVSLSNHQLGCAMDVSLARIRDAEEADCGGYPYLHVTRYEECTMPTKMHEVSTAACLFTTAVDPRSRTAWLSAEYSDTMTPDAILLQEICTGAGLYPLASEWWHFNDLDAKEENRGSLGSGGFYIGQGISALPEP